MWHPGGYPDNAGPDANDPQVGPCRCFATRLLTSDAELQGLARSGCVEVAGLNEAMCWAFRTDNSGPAVSINEV